MDKYGMLKGQCLTVTSNYFFKTMQAGLWWFYTLIQIKNQKCGSNM